MKVLFVGLGGIGQRHLRNLIHIEPDAEIYAIRKRREQFVLAPNMQIVEGEQLEQKYGIHVIDSMKEAIDIGIDTIFICSPSSMHMEYMISALEHGLDVFVEKPLSDSMEGIGHLSVCLKECSSVTMIGYQNRFHPCIKKAAEILEKNLLGDICSVSASIGENIKGWHKYEDYRRMYAGRKDLGGGVILSQIHELDYLYSFFGMPRTIYAMGGQLSDLEIDVEDVAELLMSVEVNGRMVPVHVHEDYLQIPPERKCKILGTGGYLEFDLINSSIVRYDKEGVVQYQETFIFERNDMFMEELHEFMESRKTRHTTSIPLEEGINSLRIALAAKESMKSGIIVEMGLFNE